MSKVFSNDAVEQLGKNYSSRAKPEHGGSSRGGCMKAVYIGLGSLFGARYDFKGSFHQAFWRESRRQEKARNLPEGRRNTIDRVFRSLEKEGVAGAEQEFKPTSSGWTRSDGTSVPSLETEVIDQVSTLPDGSHFFGVAASGAIHSLILRVDKNGSNVTVFWMDQFSDGYNAVRAGGFVNSPDVTGKHRTGSGLARTQALRYCVMLPNRGLQWSRLCQPAEAVRCAALPPFN